MTSVFLKSSEVKIEYDTSVVPLVINCTAYVRDKMNTNMSYAYHPVFGKAKQKGDAWPSKTDMACMHCCHTFENVPLPIPRKYDSTHALYHVYGNFCSVNCAKAYIIEHEPGISTTRMLYLNHLVRNVYGIHTSVKPAPPKIRLKMFGGDLSIAQFRDNFHQIHSQVQQPPFVSSLLLFADTPDPIAGEQGPTATSKNRIDFAPPPSPSSSKGLYQTYLDERRDVGAESDTTSIMSDKPSKSHIDPPLSTPSTPSIARKVSGTKRPHGTLNAFVTFRGTNA